MIGDWGRWRWPEVRATGIGALLVVIAAIVVTAAAQVYASLEGASFSDLSRDAAAVLDGPNYTGYYAMFTVLVWSGSAAVVLFCSVLMHRASDREASRFLLFGGSITAIMALDDAFLLHETVGYRLGDREEIFFVAYGLATAAFAWLYRRRLGPGLLLLAGAFGCWFSSTAFDYLLSTDAPFIVEDGLKLVGVALWSYLMIRISSIEVQKGGRPAEPVHPEGAALQGTLWPEPDHQVPDGSPPPADVRSPSPQLDRVRTRHRRHQRLPSSSSATPQHAGKFLSQGQGPVDDATRPVRAQPRPPRHAGRVLSVDPVPLPPDEDATTPVTVVPPRRVSDGVHPPAPRPERDRSRH